jgi:ATP-dependent protease Clp ATPase subunit
MQSIDKDVSPPNDKCSFCGKDRKEVWAMCYGLEGVTICNLCIGGCLKVIGEHLINKLTRKNNE